MNQSEIDSLMTSLASGFDMQGESAGSSEAAGGIKPKKSEKSHRPYDFKKPKKFSNDHIQNISRIYDNYAKHLSAFMSGILRAECELKINAIEEQRYFEYSNALPETIMMGVFDAKPIEGSMLMEIKKETCFLIIDRMLGGSGDVPFVQEDFSEIEIKLMERFFRHVMRFLKDAWTNVTDLEPTLERIETNARLTQIMPLEETVLIIMINLRINEHEGTMSVCVPGSNLDVILDEAANFAIMSRKKKNNDTDKTRNNIFEHIRTSGLDVRGILGNTTLTLQEISHLQVGDVIPIDKTVDSPVVLRVGKIDWFDGEIGIKKNKMAVRIKNVLRQMP